MTEAAQNVPSHVAAIRWSLRFSGPYQGWEIVCDTRVVEFECTVPEPVRTAMRAVNAVPLLPRVSVIVMDRSAAEDIATSLNGWPQGGFGVVVAEYPDEGTMGPYRTRELAEKAAQTNLADDETCIVQLSPEQCRALEADLLADEDPSRELVKP